MSAPSLAGEKLMLCRDITMLMLSRSAVLLLRLSLVSPPSPVSVQSLKTSHGW